MGRVDISQNRHYQHLALSERRKAASIVPYSPIATVVTTESEVMTPLNLFKKPAAC